MSAVRVGAGGLAMLALAWLGGTALQLQQADVQTPAHAAAWCVASLALLALAVVWGRRAATAAGRALALALAALGLSVGAFALAECRAQLRLGSQLAPELEGRDLVITGAVAELPRLSVQGTRFVFRPESARLAGGAAPASTPPSTPPSTPAPSPGASPGASPASSPASSPSLALPARLSLAWFHGFDGESLLSRPSQPLVAGDRWELTVRLKRPHGPMNPHGFDLERWLFEQDLRATGYVRPGARWLGSSGAHPVERLRQRVRDAILLRVEDSGAAGVVAALAVGDQAAIDRGDWDLFRVTGVAHLMSISGLHVTMFAWLAGALVGAAWRRSARLTLAWPAPAAARWGGLALAFGYALLAGFGVPAQRTVLMLAVVVALRAGAVRWPAPLVLLAAAVAVTLLEPWALLQPGFWLSFAAVALLMMSTPASAREEPAPARGTAAPSWFERLAAQARAGLRTQVVASLGLAPLTLVFFQQVSVIGFAANLLAIPWVTLVVTPLALLGVLLPPLWALAGWAVQGMNAVLAALAQAPVAQWTAAAAPGWAMAAGLAGGALLVLPLPWRLRLLGLPLLLPLLVPPIERPPAGAFEVVAVDVGQGTAVLVRTRSRLLVYDAGPRYAGESDAGERIVLPLLRARGERTVDMLVLSHRDTDHVGGAQALLDDLPVHAMLSSLEDGHPLLQAFRTRAAAPRSAGADPAPQPCVDGQRWSWDGVDFEMLHPLPPARATVAAEKPNARSCVLRVVAANGRRLLLTGDIEAAQEDALVARAGTRLRSEVLVVPHHGSRTSSTQAFVEAVAPRVAMVQAGYRNRFGHPVPDVAARYESLGVEWVRSDRCGAWTWASHTAQGVCERERQRRYWHLRPG